MFNREWALLSITMSVSFLLRLRYMREAYGIKRWHASVKYTAFFYLFCNVILFYRENEERKSGASWFNNGGQSICMQELYSPKMNLNIYSRYHFLIVMLKQWESIWLTCHKLWWDRNSECSKCWGRKGISREKEMKRIKSID